MRNQKSKNQLYEFVLTAILAALICIMTVVPYLGYISYGGVIEITTLHIVVIVGSVFLGWRYGAILGGVWGLTCIFRAMTNPLWAAFLNPMVSLVPRILVGIVAALVFKGLVKLKCPKIPAAGIAAAAATLTNTVLVLSALAIFGDSTGMTTFFDVLKTVYLTVIGVNGLIELGAAVVLVPVICLALWKRKHN